MACKKQIRQQWLDSKGFGAASPIPDVVNVVEVTFEKVPGISLRQRTNAKNRRKMIIVYKWETVNKAPILEGVRITSILEKSADARANCLQKMQEQQYGRENNEGGKGHVPGPVEQSGKVLLGDELIAVNAQTIPSHDFRATVEMLKAAFWPITLRFRRVLSEQQMVAAIRHPNPSISIPARVAALRSIAESSERTSLVDASIKDTVAKTVDGQYQKPQSNPGGGLILMSIEARSAIAHNNRLLISRALELDSLIARTRLAVDRHAEGALDFIGN